MNRTLLGTAGLIVAFVLFLLVNAFATKALTGMRIDLTEDRLYTLSDGTRRIMGGLDEPVTLRYYFSSNESEEVASLRPYAERVRGLLREYVAASNGKLTLEELDPEPFSEAEDAAVEAGIPGVLPQGSQPGTDPIYFGLVVSGSTDEREVIPFFDPRREQSVEYDVSKLIHKLGTTSRPVVALVTALPMEGQEAMPFPGAPPAVAPWYILESLQQIFDVRVLGPEATELPADTSVALVVHPKNVSERLLYSLDQFVLKGGHAMVFTDPFCQADLPPEDPGNPMAQFTALRDSNLGPLAAAWGVEMVPDKVVADRKHALEVTAGSQMRPERVNYVAWLGLGEEAINADDFVTAELEQVLVATAGALKPLVGATTEFVPLISTSKDAALLEASSFQFPPDPKRLLADFVPDGSSYVIAARVRGPAKTAFPDGRPAAPVDPRNTEPPPPEEPDPGFVAESSEPINVILVADADMLQDQWWVRVQDFFGTRLAMPVADNGDLVANALDNLSGSNDLIGVRSRRSFARPFEVVEELQREANQRFLAREQALQEALRTADQRINELQAQKEDGSSLILSAEQRAEIDRFRAEQVATRKQLRDVQHDLRKDIDRLHTRVQLINIGLVPLLLGVVAVGLGAWRSRRRRD